MSINNSAVILSWERSLSAMAIDNGLDSYTVRYLTNRLRAEGVKFLTVTLPKLGKSLLFSASIGEFKRPTCFAWKGRSLRYFRSLLNKIFCPRTGKLLPDFDVVSFNALRQFTEYWYKLGLDFEPAVLDRSEEKYVSTQKDVASHVFDPSWVNTLRKNAESHYKSLFKGSPDCILSEGPKNGPGTFVHSDVVQRLMGIHWSLFKELSDDKSGTCNSRSLPYSGYFKPYPSSKTKIKIVKEDRLCEVKFVKKDSRGPRVISKEPLHQLRAQMSFFTWMSKRLERVTKRRVNFVDQSINQRLACQGSIDGSWATLDLKDASDRVSIRLIRQVFRHSPVKWFLQNMRSTHYKLPSGNTGELHSVSGMGSGLTFPILAFIVHLSVCTSLCEALRLPFDRVSRNVYVYGDDLIVPTEYVHLAKAGLEKSGLLVNDEKSYSSGYFRESCGGDYIKGNFCAPTRLKLSFCDLPTPERARDGLVLSRDAKLITALVAHTHELRRNGLNKSAEYLEVQLSKLIPMPYVGSGSPVLGRWTWDSTLVYQQATRGDCESPDGYVYAAVSTPVNLDARSRCPYKFLSKHFKRVEPIQLFTGVSSGVTSFDVIPKPRNLKLKFGRRPVMALTEVRA